MDLLYQRYASPFSFIDGVIRSGSFTDFVFDFVKMVVDEREEKFRWEVWLHRVWDCSYEDFKKELENDKKNQQMSKSDFEATITDSLNILENFNPTVNGGEDK